MDVINIVESLWLALAVVWVIGRFTAKRVKQRESPAAYLGRAVLLVVFFELLFSPGLAIGWLGVHFAPRGRALDVAAIVIAALGVALAIWARLCLAGNWSGTVTLKEGHELIRGGPYKWIRHPIYTGFDMAILGTALAVGEWRGILVFVGVGIAHTLKARKEEAWLAREFGPAFDEHRKRTGMFFPRLMAP